MKNQFSKTLEHTLIAFLFGLIILTSYPFSFLNKLDVHSVQTIKGSNYKSGENLPLQLGTPERPNLNYIYLSFKFKATDFSGHPNLFQTANYNQGIRLEISEAGSALLVPLKGSSAALKAMPISIDQDGQRWHELVFELLNHNYINVTLDQIAVVSFKDPAIAADLSNIIVGGGFDSTRYFKGEIKEVLAKTGIHDQTFFNISGYLLIFRILLGFLSIWLWWRHVVSESLTQKLTQVETQSSVDYLGIRDNDYLEAFGRLLVYVLIGVVPALSINKNYFGLAKWGGFLMAPLFFFSEVYFFNFTRKNQNRKVLHYLTNSLIWMYAGIVVFFSVKSSTLTSLFIQSFCIGSIIFYEVFSGFEKLLSVYRRNIISILILIFSWTAIVDLSNWSDYISHFDTNFGLTFVGTLIILKLVLTFLNSPKREHIDFSEARFRFSLNCAYRKFWFFVSKAHLPDLIVVFLFFYFSFRDDSLFKPTNSGTPLYHWEYFVGVIRSIRNGGWLLYDTPSQYGFLNILLASSLPFKSALQSFYVFQGLLLFIVSTSLYFSIKKLFKWNSRDLFVIFVLIFCSLFFADPELIGPYPFPSSSVVRFFCVYMFFLFFTLVPIYGRSQAIGSALVLVCSILWSAESAVYGISIYLFNLLGLFLDTGTKGQRKNLVLEYGRSGIIIVLIALFAMSVPYLVFLDRSPEFISFIEHALGYAGGFGFVPFPVVGPINILINTFVVLVILVKTQIKNHDDNNDNDDNIVGLSPLMAMAGGLWGVATYYIGRPVAQNVTAILPILTTILLIGTAFNRNAKGKFGSELLSKVSIPIFFIVLMQIFNPTFWQTLISATSLTSNVGSNLWSNEKNEIVQLLNDKSVNFQSEMPISYYGDDAALPIRSWETQQLSEKQWLPGPFQLFEAPLRQSRMKIYFQRYICRVKMDAGLLIHRKGETSGQRLQMFLDEINRYYTLNRIMVGKTFDFYFYDKLNLSTCMLK